MSYIEHDKHVESIYKKVLVTRTQISERTRKLAEQNLFFKLEGIFQFTVTAYSNPKFSKKDIDQMQRELSTLLDLVVMHTDHDVIMSLINEEISKKFKKKILES